MSLDSEPSKAAVKGASPTDAEAEIIAFGGVFGGVGDAVSVLGVPGGAVAVMVSELWLIAPEAPVTIKIALYVPSFV